MKILLLLVSLASLALSCEPVSNNHDNPDINTVTMLSEDEILKLSPYMVDVKRVGDLVQRMDTLNVNDSLTLLLPGTKQSFTFRVLLDENNYPVMPDTTTAVARRAGNWQNGSITTFCFGGCIQFIGNSLCLADACTPMDNACGCIPPACNGGCELLTCSSEIMGAMSRKVSFR